MCYDSSMALRQNDNKLDQVAPFVIARTFANELGATKLNKVLWLADIIAFRERSDSITGIENYKRLPHGPVPIQITSAIRNLKSANMIAEVSNPTPIGNRREFVSLIEPSIDCFSGSDIDIIHRAIEFITPLSAKKISEITHDSYWEEVPENGDMAPSAASLVLQDFDESAISWAEKELAEELS